MLYIQLSVVVPLKPAAMKDVDMKVNKEIVNEAPYLLNSVILLTTSGLIYTTPSLHTMMYPSFEVPW